MRALNWLKELREDGFIPCSKEGAGLNPPSNSELRRWCEKGSVIINRRRVRASDIIIWPTRQLLFFSQSPRSRTTLQYDYRRRFTNDWWGGPSNKKILKGIIQIWDAKKEKEIELVYASGNPELAKRLEQRLSINKGIN